MKQFVFLLSLILLLCGGCKYFKKQTPHSPQLITVDSTPADSTFDSAAYYAQASESVLNTQLLQQNSPVSGNYYMIVGCFKVDVNADRYAEKIRAMGYDVQILDARNEFQMVAARSYNNYREGVNDIEKFRNEVTPNAWVYRQR